MLFEGENENLSGTIPSGMKKYHFQTKSFWWYSLQLVNISKWTCL